MRVGQKWALLQSSHASAAGGVAAMVYSNIAAWQAVLTPSPSSSMVLWLLHPQNIYFIINVSLYIICHDHIHCCQGVQVEVKNYSAKAVQSVYASASFLAEIPLRSPRKLFIFII